MIIPESSKFELVVYDDDDDDEYDEQIYEKKA
jgi:hypothetical protein